jgi:hypothetical protein
MRETLPAYVKWVRELAEQVCGNDQMTTQSLAGPTFSIESEDLTDPCECIPKISGGFRAAHPFCTNTRC